MKSRQNLQVDCCRNQKGLKKPHYSPPGKRATLPLVAIRRANPITPRQDRIREELEATKFSSDGTKKAAAPTRAVINDNAAVFDVNIDWDLLIAQPVYLLFLLRLK